MINDVTPDLNLPLPHPENELADDVTRLRSALGMLDSIVASKVGQQQIDDALAHLVDSAPDVLDTIRELAAALGNDPDFAAHVAAQILALQSGLAGVLTGLDGKADTAAVTVLIETEQSARSAADTALAGQISGLTSSTRMKSYFNYGA